MYLNGIKIIDAMLKSNLMKNKLHYMLETPKDLNTIQLNSKNFNVCNNGQSAGNQIKMCII